MKMPKNKTVAPRQMHDNVKKIEAIGKKCTTKLLHAGIVTALESWQNQEETG